jgi:hypothetical protein
MLKRDGRGVEVNVFFLLSFDVWKEERKGMILFFYFIFSLFKIKFPPNVITTIY